MENIQDVNTKDGAVREINLKIKFKPSDDREKCAYEISCKTKLAPNKGIGNVAYIGQENGKPVLYEVETNQIELFPGNVQPLKESEGTK